MNELNTFAFLSLMCSLMSASSAVLSVASIRKGAPILWGAISLILALWAFGLFMGFSAHEANAALFWARNANYAMLFLPVLLFHFVAVFVDRLPFLNRVLRLYYGMTLSCFFAVLVWPALFLDQAYRRLDMFWFPLAGPLFYFFLILFLLIMGHSLHILFISKQGQDRTNRLRIDYLILTVIVGLLGGGSTVPLEFGFDIPPYGVLGVAFINAFFTYAILKHDLLDLPQTVSFILARLLAYIGIFALIVLVLKNDIFLNSDLLSIQQIFPFALLTVVISELYAALKDRIQLLSNRMLLRDKVSSENALQTLMRRLEGQPDVESMLPLLKDYFGLQEHVHHFAWYMDQMLLEHTLTKQTMQDYTRSDVLDDCVYQRILFSSNDGLRHDKLPAILRLNKLGFSKCPTAKSQMIELMGSEQLDAAYAWVDKVPDRELIAIPIIAHDVFRGLLLIVVSHSETRYSDQVALQKLASNLASMIERLEFFHRQSAQQQAFLLEKMSSLQALAGSIAHEMRTPLTQLGYFVDDVKASLLEQTADLEPMPELAFQSLQAQTAIKRSLQVIDITLGQVRNSPIDKSIFKTLSIHSVINKALAEYVFLPGEREWVNCDLRQTFNLRGDETLLIYLIFNLLKNALYFSQTVQPFQISITSHIEEKHNTLLIRDNGPGIPTKHLEKIFDDFFSTDRFQGTGLGLAYCRRVMLSFGGDISCHSEVGTFTEFKLTFLPMT